MAALDAEKDRIQYIQVRHEQVGALAASADAKLTGRVQVCFGSAGPGATNLLTGLYDAREDHAPVVALIGQVPTTNMNYNYFQEFAENPMFEDVAVYNRTVMTAESLPYVVDKAAREAYKHKGVAVVVIPNNFGYVQIPDEPYSSSSPTDRKPAPLPLPTDEEVKNVLGLIKAANAQLFTWAAALVQMARNSWSCPRSCRFLWFLPVWLRAWSQKSMRATSVTLTALHARLPMRRLRLQIW